MSERTLIRKATVITSAVAGEVLTDTDILIEGGRIAAIGTDLPVGDAEVLDFTGRIVMPGFVDTHRHTWQSVVRDIASDWSLTEYLAGLHTGLSKYYRPEDTYAGNYLGALEALDSGITTLVDWSHNLATPEHADAAIKALQDTGMRAVFAHGGGNKQWGAPLPSPDNHPEDARRIREQYFSDNTGLVTMAMALRGPQFTTPEVNRHDFALAKDLDLRVTVHVGDGYWGKSGPIYKLRDDGLLSDRITYVHCDTSPTRSWTSSRHPAAPRRSLRTWRCRWGTGSRRRAACSSTASARPSRSTYAAATAATCSARCARPSACSARSTTPLPWKRERSLSGSGSPAPRWCASPPSTEPTPRGSVT